MRIRHAKVSAVPDGGDPAKVQPSDWNADHIIDDSCTPCLKSVWIPANDFVPDDTGGVSAATLTIPAVVPVKTDVLSYANSLVPAISSFTIKMPADWNNGPYWLEFDWTINDLPASGTMVTWIAQQLSAEHAIQLGGFSAAARTVVSTASLPYVINTVRMHNLYPTYSSDGAIIVFLLMRATTDTTDDMDEEAHVFGATLHYTPKDCDYNLLSEYYLVVDSCSGHEYSGDFYQQILVSSDSLPLQTTNKVNTEGDAWGSLTFEIQFGGSIPELTVAVSSDLAAFSAVSVPVEANTGSVYITVRNDLANALSPGDTLTVSVSEWPAAWAWTLKSVVLSMQTEPTGCAVVYHQP